MSRVNEMRGGRDNDPRFGSRMTGEGLFAQLLRRRVGVARKRLGLAASPPVLAIDRFRPPGDARQPGLF